MALEKRGDAIGFSAAYLRAGWTSEVTTDGPDTVAITFTSDTGEESLAMTFVLVDGRIEVGS